MFTPDSNSDICISVSNLDTLHVVKFPIINAIDGQNRDRGQRLADIREELKVKKLSMLLPCDDIPAFSMLSKGMMTVRISEARKSCFASFLFDMITRGALCFGDINPQWQVPVQ
jgi:hypothetical protein